jgi:carbamate kinase
VSCIVVGLGGNALLRRDDRTDWATQRRRAERAAARIAPLARHGGLVVTHGNGPQVGLLALEQLAARHDGADPLDALDALTEGSLGYLIGLALTNSLGGRPAVTVLTQVEVDPDDPAFRRPSKPIGPAYAAGEAARLGTEHGWTFSPAPGGLRRTVGSPEPKTILACDALATLVSAGHVVVCGGGGGIPVVRDPVSGHLAGVEAVIDKDLTTARLAIDLGADALVLLTDVDAVVDGFGTTGARRLHKLAVSEARRLDLPPGSMGPKVEAACRFAEATGRVAGIGALDAATDVVLGRAGTLVAAGPVQTRYWD